MIDKKMWTEVALSKHLAMSLASEPERYLLRGQRKIFPATAPFLSRLEGEALRQAYAILRRLVGNYRSQIFASPELRGVITADVEEVIALLQHYGWPTPYMDLTDDIDVAFFFACLGHQPPDEAIIFTVDRSQLSDSFRVVHHQDVVDPEVNPRWARQHGYGLSAVKWQDMGEVRALELNSAAFAHGYRFTPDEQSTTWVARKATYYLPEVGAIGAQLHFLVTGLAQMCKFESLLSPLSRFPY